MKAIKITEGEIAHLKVASLPSRPNAPTAVGGRGYTATQMKEAFDKLPLLLVDRFNALLEDIAGAEGGLTDSIPSGIKSGHTLADLLRDLTSGELCNYLSVSGESLTTHLAKLRLELDIIERDMGNAFSGFEYFILDCGDPKGLSEMIGGGMLG